MIAAILKPIKWLAAWLPRPGRAAGKKRSPQWPACRAAHLMVFPTCAACGTTRGLEVHHVRPFHLFPQLELEHANLITLCEHHGCHYCFGHLYSWHAFNPDVRGDANRHLSRVRTRRYADASIPIQQPVQEPSRDPGRTESRTGGADGGQGGA